MLRCLKGFCSQTDFLSNLVPLSLLLLKGRQSLLLTCIMAPKTDYEYLSTPFPLYISSSLLFFGNHPKSSVTSSPSFHLSVTFATRAVFGLLRPLFMPPMARSSGCAASTMRSLFMAIGLWIILSPSLVSAYNNLKFVNHCPYDVYSWTVGPAGSGLEGRDHEAVTIPANSVTVHGMYNGETMHGGIAIKLRDIPKYQVAPAGIIQVEYNLEPSQNNLWYDLSAIDCNHNVGNEDPSYCPLIAGGMKVSVQKVKYGRCPTAWCGADGCHNVYKEHGFWQGEPTFRCDADTDIFVELCTERAGPRTFNGHLEPGHPADPDMEPGNTTANGVCGAKTSGGATCFGYAHGACCSCKYLSTG